MHVAAVNHEGSPVHAASTPCSAAKRTHLRFPWIPKSQRLRNPRHKEHPSVTDFSLARRSHNETTTDSCICMADQKEESLTEHRDNHRLPLWLGKFHARALFIAGPAEWHQCGTVTLWGSVWIYYWIVKCETLQSVFHRTSLIDPAVTAMVSIRFEKQPMVTCRVFLLPLPN